ncbi:MAG: hypothetical protein AB8I08_29585 [Sandaracinaceae bacterium]
MADAPSHLRCPSCGTFIPREAVNETHRAAVCRNCGTPFALPQRAAQPERRIPMPKGITLESGEPPLRPPGGYRDTATAPLPELVLRRRWFRWQALFLTGFAIFWNGFLVVWYAGMFATEGFHPIGVCFPLVHVAAGIGISYYTAALWLNSSVLSVRDGQLQVRHGPLPWRGNCDLPVSSVRQLVHVRRVHQRKNGTSVTWEVHAYTHDHDEITLLRGLSKVQEARYVEWVIEEHLGIEDDPHQNQT